MSKSCLEKMTIGDRVVFRYVEDREILTDIIVYKHPYFDDTLCTKLGYHMNKSKIIIRIIKKPK